jgi:uncharacterized protein (DUF433 family)
VKAVLSPGDEYRQLLDSPAYPLAEAARLVGLSSGQVRRWLKGYEFHYPTKRQPQLRHSKKPPVVPRGVDVEATYVSFLNLIDLLLVREFLREGFTLQQLRSIFAEAKRILKIDHLAYKTFFTIGRKVFLEIDDKAIVALMSGGQLAIDKFIRELGHQIEFDEETKLAIRWYPLHPDRNVVIDPHVSFGHPVVAGRRITTSNVFDFYQAEHRKIDVVCDWMDIEQAKAESAVRFELQLAA